MDEREAWIFLNRMPHWTPLRFRQLREIAGSALAILQMEVQDLCRVVVSEAVAAEWVCAFRNPVHHQDFERELLFLQEGRFGVVTELDADYPASLRELSDRPPVLYYQGRWPPPERYSLGLVGTRYPSPYGISVAQFLTCELVSLGCITVSGLALGIDGCVHETTLEEQGYTVAVLGNGLGCHYPRENRKLQQRISESGVVLSEFPYNRKPEAWHFPRRNRIISGLSQGIVVIEAGLQSGALITARYAAEQGREVFAVPGNVFQSTSQGCHRLLKQGAKLVQNAKDILEEFGVPSPCAVSEVPASSDEPDLSAPEKEILDALHEEALSVDELALKVSTPVSELSNHLLHLELKGKVRPLPGQRYASNKKN